MDNGQYDLLLSIVHFKLDVASACHRPKIFNDRRIESEMSVSCISYDPTARRAV